MLARRDAARFFARAVHTRRIELNDAVGVRQAAEPDAVVERVQFDDVDAGDERVEHVVAVRDALEGRFDARLRAAVRESMAVGRRDDDRRDAETRDHRGQSTRGRSSPV